jgi:hypothetical protein
MDAVLLIIGIVYGICRIVKLVQQCTYFLFSVNLLLVGVNYNAPLKINITCATNISKRALNGEKFTTKKSSLELYYQRISVCILELFA